jgi:hypothetical protein
MTDLLHNPVFLSLAAGVLIVVVCTVPAYWYKTRKASLEAELKRDMVARGMSADEICRVIESRAGGPDRQC